ncbi:aerotolerance-related cytoplasmic membrane protein BatA [Candidatus Endomicrobiellum trichonymphae]|uniref:Aerotolerance-related cytoplasmic membrane protein BatA n=1 Tax=Endomicrobium trichonymphae TaxID=1408204 RepID=B1GZR4_ENDTX|nr:aerotolerance-related cytoplasmic membrane protein BatA [Candidatus Endomicrobium trichonymphae]
MRFANPLYLLIFLPLLALAYVYISIIKKNSFKPCISFSRVNLLKSNNPEFKKILLNILKVLKCVSLILIIIALAKPQKGKTFEHLSDQGIDIIVALDTSTSMRSLDFRSLNRMEAAKKVIRDFMKERKYDRIGLVIFSGLAFTQCPLTTDKDSLAEFINNINIGDTGLDGTAIGSAIMTSVNRLKDSRAKSRIIILVTDGNNNMGEIDPLTASKIARSYDIKIYAVGVGSLDGAIYEVDDPFLGKREIKYRKDAINESVLKEVAYNTSGGYFRAQDVKSFENIMKQIDKLEKDDIEVMRFTNYRELYKYFLIPSFILLLLIIVLENTYLRKLP